MNIYLLVVVVLLSLWMMYSSSRAERKRIQRLADPSSTESIKAKQIIEGLPADIRSSISREIDEGNTLSGIKKLRAHVQGLGFYDAKNAIDLLKRSSRCA